ncbi:RagB/SusD family nutrient uptake outer membrane protein [Pedobacter rhodius]|uniref:RagB/SusD family nutrient uptake outer membrane protein n=1 Tax=Pedobacter rhodius TaxID=3004098 RepID=A0ABT4KWH2_9SPHI|nr:RagB/SusD family nutrient uptake outer membrane protein [Pedobacter sp. SJ11]MCZ4223169.1 RagB/SusD family nutrient uptake outer membrane protein [Pedobacter sp. SJ11]
MKNLIKYTLAAFVCSMGFSSCQKLDVEVKTQLTPENFPQTEAHFVQLAGQTYSQFRQSYAVEYFFMQSISTDESIMPARGGNWYDGGRYEQHEKHTWDKDNAHISGVWNWLSTTISKCNQSLSLIDVAQESPAKRTAVAEVRTMRAICLYLMMDLWGNVPIVSKFGDVTPPETKSRSEVFNFIETEVKESLPNLNPATGISTYGRPNKYTGYALLAKMYLNAEVYIGTSRYNDAVAMCDAIMTASGSPYSLESDYRKMFFIDNGPQTKEFIFAIPYDPGYTNGYMFYARYSLPRSLQAKFSLKHTPSAPMSTLPEYYANFNDPNDKRNAQWIKGLQFDNAGKPVMVSTTKKGYDQFYTGSDGSAPLTYQVDITPNVTLRDATRPFDAGNDEIAWNMGYRNNKFYCDSTSANRNQNNDVPVFRYSDILLMKAEAILRGATPTQGQTALSLVNQLRAVRTTSPAWTSVTLEDLYKERCREMAWECWHRNDMIRFGKFEGTWGFKTDAQTFHRLFPIPASAIILNPKLKQNPGYN